MGFRVGEIMVRGVDQQRRTATLPSYSRSGGPSLLLSLPASTQPQRAFLYPELTVPSLALQRPRVESQTLGLAFKALMTWFQSVYQLDIPQLTPLQPHQIRPSPGPRSATRVVSHGYVANLQQKPWMPRLG